MAQAVVNSLRTKLLVSLVTLGFCCWHVHQNPSSMELSVPEVLPVLYLICYMCAPCRCVELGQICCLVQIRFMLTRLRL